MPKPKPQQLPAATAQIVTTRIWNNTAVRSSHVTLAAYLPKQTGYDGTGIIVCPGGSYCWHDYKTEGTLVAEWLNTLGIAAFVLRYRVQGYIPFATHSRLIFGGHQHPQMLEDIQRSIQLVRENATAYSINPARVGTMGFSAGGHLAMSAIEHATTDYLAPHGIQSAVSLRPDFAALIYPVVSMSHSCTHTRSRRALLGEKGKNDESLRQALSLEMHVPADCPPIFLVNCADDPIVHYHNSELLATALSNAAAPHRYIQYKTGGHGFGASNTKGTAECREWRREFVEWLNQHIKPEQS